MDSEWTRLSAKNRPGRPGKDTEIRGFDSEDGKFEFPMGSTEGTW